MSVDMNRVYRAERRLRMAHDQMQPAAVIQQAVDAVRVETAIAWLPEHMRETHRADRPWMNGQCPHCNPDESVTVALARLVVAQMEAA